MLCDFPAYIKGTARERGRWRRELEGSSGDFLMGSSSWSSDSAEIQDLNNSCTSTPEGHWTGVISNGENSVPDRVYSIAAS